MPSSFLTIVSYFIFSKHCGCTSILNEKIKNNSYLCLVYILRRNNNGERVKNQTRVNFNEPVTIRNKQKKQSSALKEKRFISTLLF